METAALGYGLAAEMAPQHQEQYRAVAAALQAVAVAARLPLALVRAAKFAFGRGKETINE